MSIAPTTSHPLRQHNLLSDRYDYLKNNDSVKSLFFFYLFLYLVVRPTPIRSIHLSCNNLFKT